MSSAPILRYFEPLIKWLEKDKAAKGWVTGWDIQTTWTPHGYDESQAHEIVIMINITAIIFHNKYQRCPFKNSVLPYSNTHFNLMSIY